MEDGKNRHLYQLEAKKEQVLKTFPDDRFNDYLQFMKTSIKGRKFPQSMFRCCRSKKYRKVNPDFIESFDQLPQQAKISYYRRYLELSESISTKKTKLPETFNNLDEIAPVKQTINIRYKLYDGKKYRTVQAVLNHHTKMIQTSDFKLDLHRAFVIITFDQFHKKDLIFVYPWRSNCKIIEIIHDLPKDNILFQRFSNLADLAIQENIVRIIDGEEPIHAQDEEVVSTQRSLQNRMVEEISPPSILHAIRQVQQISYLTYRHPAQSLTPPQNPIRLESKQNKHYFFQGQYDINSDGELVAINKEKLEAQGSVIKYIIKRIFSGGKIFNISLPVTVFGQESNLSLLISQYRHAPTELQSAALQSKPLGRFLQVMRFALTCPACYIRCDKPFNPIFGETYQATVDGTLFYGEQICHHPPISAVFIKGRGYTVYGNFQADIKFGLNSACGNNKGWLKISFDKHDISRKVVRFNHAPGQMTGMVLGARKLSLKESITFIDEESMLFCQMKIGKIKLQKKVKQYADSVEGMIVRLKPGTPLDKPENITEKDIVQQLGLISGRWLSDVLFKGLLLINTLNQKPPEIERYPALLPSDYSLRQDIIKKRMGLIEESQKYKEQLQEIQRRDRNLRQNYQK